MANPQNPTRYPHQQQTGTEYIVVSNYRPQDVERCIACLANDVIFVQVPYIFEFQGTPERPTGWLYGENLRTGEMGYVPADFVKYNSGFSGEKTTNRRPALDPVSEEEDDSDTEAPPPIPPPRGRNNIPEGPQPIETNEWYFGSVTKEEVNRIMQGTATGTFLVRDSSNQQAGYTLTLRKDEANKLIRIHREGAKYGFSSPCEFNSVAELINYHRSETLARYNSELNICLRFSAQQAGRPISVGYSKDELIDRLTNTHRKLIEKSTLYDEIYHEFNTRHQRIQHKKTAIDAYNKTIEIFRDQCATLEESMNKSIRDEDRLSENFRKLQTRLQDISNQRQHLQLELENDVQLNREKDPLLSTLKHEIQEIKREQDECISKLEMLGIPESEIRHQYLHDGYDDREPFNEVDENQLRYRFPNHANKDNWFFSNYKRSDAEQLLAGQQDGTFLIRLSQRAPYACSLICGGRVHHCLIKKTEEGYGFAEPFNLHQSLTDLVIHYAVNSLLPHNDNLDTTLKVPAGLILRRR